MFCLSRCALLSPQKRLVWLAAAALVMVGSSATSRAAQVWYPFPYPTARYAEPESAVRLEVTPREAEVYVDGYYAGIVDDFDGIFQRLRLPPGEHGITLYRDGYRSVTERVYLTPRSTFKIRYRMEPLGPGEVAEPRPVPLTPPTPTIPPGPRAGQPPPRGPFGRPPPPNLPPPNGPPGAAPPPDQLATGTLSIRVQPSDADVMIDGQPWRGPAGQDRIVIDASVGRHNIQIRKPGYVGYLTDVQVRRGETTTLDVSLRTQQQ